MKKKTFNVVFNLRRERRKNSCGGKIEAFRRDVLQPLDQPIATADLQ